MTNDKPLGTLMTNKTKYGSFIQYESMKEKRGVEQVPTFLIWRRLSLQFYKTVAVTFFPISQLFYSLFLHGIIVWVFKNTPLRNGTGGQMGKSTYTIGGRSKRTCAHNGEGGQTLAIFERKY